MAAVCVVHGARLMRDSSAAPHGGEVEVEAPHTETSQARAQSLSETTGTELELTLITKLLA